MWLLSPVRISLSDGSVRRLARKPTQRGWQARREPESRQGAPTRLRKPAPQHLYSTIRSHRGRVGTRRPAGVRLLRSDDHLKAPCRTGNQTAVHRGGRCGTEALGIVEGDGGKSSDVESDLLSCLHLPTTRCLNLTVNTDGVFAVHDHVLEAGQVEEQLAPTPIHDRRPSTNRHPEAEQEPSQKANPGMIRTDPDAANALTPGLADAVV